MNKLKEISKKWFNPIYSFRLEGRGNPDAYPREIFFDDTEFTKAVDFIQTESYKLGRQEVIDKLTRDTENRTPEYIAGIVKVIIAEYNQEVSK